MNALSGFRLASFLSVLAGLFLVASDGWGQEKIGVSARKLVVIDKLATSAKAKVVYAAEDPAVTKGAAADVDNISALLTISYAATSGSFLIPPGSYDGTSGWTSNDPAGAAYVNRISPNGPTRAKKVTLKEASHLTLKARGVGDIALDIVGAGAPSATVSTLYCFSNGPDQICHCSKFSECSYKVVSGGDAAKLVCRNAAPDPTCNTTSSTTPTTAPPLS